MLVRQWMSPHPVTVTRQTSVLNARRLMRVQRVRHLPVVDDGDRVVGMISDRDVSLADSQMVRALSTLQSDLASGRYRPVQTVMSTPVHTVSPDEPVSLAADVMLRWQVSGMPVVDGGRLVGIITSTDCLRALLRELGRDRPDVAPDAKAGTRPPVEIQP